tara:strand:+ start:330 stop:848 length:519 start_codon:yes stop_codon:yes gene_type:complete
MIRLINGRGQVGAVLRTKTKDIEIEKSICIYHTWNINDKSLDVQKSEYKKFVTFVADQRLKEKIIFISTSSKKDTWYNFYKQQAEAYLLSNTTDGTIIRLPTLIGKGVFQKFKTGDLKPEGYFNLMSVDDATDLILESVSHTGKTRVTHVDGEKVSARNVFELINFGSMRDG